MRAPIVLTFLAVLLLLLAFGVVGAGAQPATPRGVGVSVAHGPLARGINLRDGLSLTPNR